MKTIFAIFILLAALSLRAASPSFQQFDTNDFTVVNFTRINVNTNKFLDTNSPLDANKITGINAEQTATNAELLSLTGFITNGVPVVNTNIVIISGAGTAGVNGSYTNMGKHTPPAWGADLGWLTYSNITTPNFWLTTSLDGNWFIMSSTYGQQFYNRIGGSVSSCEGTYAVQSYGSSPAPSVLYSSNVNSTTNHYPPTLGSLAFSNSLPNAIPTPFSVTNTYTSGWDARSNFVIGVWQPMANDWGGGMVSLFGSGYTNVAPVWNIKSGSGLTGSTNLGSAAIVQNYWGNVGWSALGGDNRVFVGAAGVYGTGGIGGSIIEFLPKKAANSPVGGSTFCVPLRLDGYSRAAVGAYDYSRHTLYYPATAYLDVYSAKDTSVPALRIHDAALATVPLAGSVEYNGTNFLVTVTNAAGTVSRFPVAMMGTNWGNISIPSGTVTASNFVGNLTASQLTGTISPTVIATTNNTTQTQWLTLEPDGNKYWRTSMTNFNTVNATNTGTLTLNTNAESGVVALNVNGQIKTIGGTGDAVSISGNSYSGNDSGWNWNTSNAGWDYYRASAPWLGMGYKLLWLNNGASLQWKPNATAAQMAKISASGGTVFFETNTVASGTATATIGFASMATNATLAVTATGVTNTLNINYQIYGFTGVGVVLTNYTRTYGAELGTLTAPDTISLQPGDALVGTSCAALGGRGL